MPSELLAVSPLAAPEPAVEYYLRAARSFLSGRDESSAQGDGDEPRMTLGVTPAQRTLGAEVLARAGVGAGEVFALINPGANNPAKRWPVERFGAIGAELARERGLRVLVTGSPDETARRNLATARSGRCRGP